MNDFGVIIWDEPTTEIFLIVKNKFFFKIYRVLIENYSNINCMYPSIPYQL